MKQHIHIPNSGDLYDCIIERKTVHKITVWINGGPTCREITAFKELPVDVKKELLKHLSDEV